MDVPKGIAGIAKSGKEQLNLAVDGSKGRYVRLRKGYILSGQRAMKLNDLGIINEVVLVDTRGRRMSLSLIPEAVSQSYEVVIRLPVEGMIRVEYLTWGGMKEEEDLCG